MSHPNAEATLVADDRVLVVGVGQMGPSIALSFALGGYAVVLAGRRADAVQRALERMAADAQALADHGLLARVDVDRVIPRVRGKVGLAGVDACSYVVEAIAEDIAAKQEVLAHLERSIPSGAVLASTTSALSPTILQQHLAWPQRMVVTHYAQPAHLVPIVEVVPGARTATGTVERAEAVLRRCGRRPVRCRDVPGFVFNRLQMAVLREALALVRESVASLEDIEAVIKLGYAARLPAMGPFEHADLVGLDLIAVVAGTVWPHLDTAQSATDGPLGDLLRRGETGIAAGRGLTFRRGQSPRSAGRHFVLAQQPQALLDNHESIAERALDESGAAPWRPWARVMSGATGP